jgi:hypothetical protein
VSQRPDRGTAAPGGCDLPRPAGWQVQDADGQVVYRGADLDLADDLRAHLPGGRLTPVPARPPGSGPAR